MVRRETKLLWWTGAYPLLLALMLGAIWVDRIYSRALQAGTNGYAFGSAPAHVADLLLMLAALTVLAGLCAAWLWQGRARALSIASLAVFCLEFVLPALVRTLPGGSIYLEQLGPFLRFGILGAALLLAALATRKVLA